MVILVPPVTHRRLKQLFAWQGMKHDVWTFVSSYVVCQQAKPDRSKLPGLLRSLPVLTMAWQVVSLDFVTGLPLSGGFDCVLVVVDAFTKDAHFRRLKHPFTSYLVAVLFHNSVYKLHGMPIHLVSDRDRVFTSQLWRALFKLADVQLCMSTSYHLQSDDQTERVN